MLVTASDRTRKSIAIYVLDMTAGKLASVADGVQPTGLSDPYGLCMYRSRRAGRTYVFISDPDGKQIRDALWVDDLIDAYERALDRIEEVRGEVFNVGGGPEHTMSLNELIGRLERACGRRLDPPRADWRPGDQRVFVADIRKAGRRLGWRPRVGTAEGVDRLLGWVRRNRGLFA